MAEPLDPITLPLAGSRLVEASAGTGKTWTIAALVVRLVLGHGAPRPYTPAEILVMTFTRAATRELSDRIRGRLVQAAAVFRGEAAPPAGDGFLPALLAAYADPADAAERRRAAARLAAAAEAMDEAAVHTIDAWCQRMLREHAFDSGSDFELELLADESALFETAVQDWWREAVYPLDDADAAALLALWPGVEALARDLRPLMDGALDGAPPASTLAAALAADRAALAALKAGWAERADELLAWFEAVWADKTHPAAKGVPAARYVRDWLATLRAWALDPATERLDIGKTAPEALSHTGLAARLAAKGCAAEPPPACAAFEDLWQALEARRQNAGAALRRHAAHAVRERLAAAKARAARLGFADLQRRLADALDEARHGERARALRARILERHPVALVDEFQDTSPVQLAILDRLYRIADDDPRHALLLIGDPKQAIYAFRGADIHSYLHARTATAGRHHWLGTNHRSTPELVAAVNALFERAERRPGGAFGFGGAAEGGGGGGGGDGSPLPFHPVTARGRAERLVAGGTPLPALQIVADAGESTKEDARQRAAERAAEQLVGWLNDPGCGFEQPGRPFARLRPSDCALLVRSGREAEALRRALARRGVASVYLSDRDSVFDSPEAADLLRWLQALAMPRDARRVRAALATALAGRSVAELVALADDDAAFERECERFVALHALWREQGVLATLRRLLHAWQLPARWLAPGAPEGERRLTNVLHLAELLQAAAAQADGEHALVRWLAAQVSGTEEAEGAGDADERVLRLESDADLVTVVTIHKSKGLEYPLVMLPFAAIAREPGRGASRPLRLPTGAGEGGEPTWCFEPGPAERERAAAEDAREELRLLYVALTRARHTVWLGLAGVAGASAWPQGALGALLSGPGAAADSRLADAQAWVDAVQAAGGTATLQVQAGDAPLPVTPLAPREPPPPLAEPPRYAARFERDWGLASYTALLRGAAPAADALPAARPLRGDEPVAEAEGASPAAARDAGPGAAPAWHRFPRGAVPGQFLHELLEALAAEGFPPLDPGTPAAAELRRRCERSAWRAQTDEVLDWLARVTTTPLPPFGAPLSALGAAVPEMEFWLPADDLDTAALDALCRRHWLPGRERPALAPRRLRGLLMGFADLVVEQGGRYWVLDHKSNALGDGDAAYTPAAMQAALLEHRYDLQAAIYLLALHRLLAARLGDGYRPAEQLGGAVFLFLRGIAAPDAGCCPLAVTPALLADLAALAPPAAVDAEAVR